MQERHLSRHIVRISGRVTTSPNFLDAPSPLNDKGEVNIWLYWEDPPNKTKPEYLNLCFESVKKHCSADFTIRIVSKQEALEMLALPPIWLQFAQIAHRADMVRAGLLAKFGGIWLDTDLIVIRSLSFLIEEIQNHGFIGYCTYDRRNPEIGFLGALQNDPIVTSWFEQAKKHVIEKNVTTFGWRELGQDMLRKYTEPQSSWKDFSHKFFCPIRAQDKGRFLTEGSIRDFIFPETATIMLFNHGFGSHPIKSMNRQEILESKLVVADAIRLGLA